MKLQILRFTSLLLMYLPLPLTVTAQVVNIPDPNLRAAVETTFGKASGAPITADEMATLTRLEALEAGVHNLTGLESATNLTELNLSGNDISDISVLAESTSLTWLNLRGNNISDISVLVGLTNLTWLDLRGNNISSLSPLAANTGLENGDQVLLNGNLLSRLSMNIHIPILHSRGVTTDFYSAVQLNFGEPLTVRLIYFLPNDQPYDTNVVQQMKDEIREVQSLYAEQMETYGYGAITFRVETGTQGEPIVHRVDGRHPDSYYLDHTLDTVLDEIDLAFNREANVYLIVIDNSINRIDPSNRCLGGFGGRRGKYGGYASVSSGLDRGLVAHELGHAFGLYHDFHDGAYIMSYGLGRTRLSPCHAEYLSVHPYFNPNPPIEEEEQLSIIELISSPQYPADSKSIPVRLKVSDSEGLHQVFLFVTTIKSHFAVGSLEVKACRELGGETDAVVEFDYDGIIPSDSSTNLSNSMVHPISVAAVDINGNERWAHFVLLSKTLQPLSKISGDNQHGLPNTPLPVPFVVQVRDLNNSSGRRRVAVTFTVTTGNGTLSVERAEIDNIGRARSTLTLGPNLGPNTVEVSVAGIEGTLTFNAVAGAAVNIPDPNLRAAVEIELRKAEREPIAPAEMLTLTCLKAPEVGIRNLTGLENATSLTGVDLSDNNISDISPVAGLTNLKWIDLEGNNISDILPVGGLTNLTGLFLESNHISNISPVGGLTNLTHLFLQDNNISDISSVGRLTNLTELFLQDNNISDILSLVVNTELGSGDTVDVRGNPLSYQSIHAHIPTLQSRGVTVEFDNQPPPVTADVNSDGNVNLLDLGFVAAQLWSAGTNLAADVNGDGTVNIFDLVLVAGMFDDVAAAPSAQPQAQETLTVVEVQGWLTDARTLEVKGAIMKRGLIMLEQFLAILTPTETELLANYPNPFNPETWVPYRLAEEANVTLTIYDSTGIMVRQLELGHQPKGYYMDRGRAAYWDGKNELGESVASGVYFYTLTAGDYSATRKMMILK